MLAYAHGTNVHRERLIDTLWPGATVDVGLRRLQVAVSSVRRLLQQRGIAEIDTVRRYADSYQLSLGDAIVDVVEFERLVVTARQEPHSVRRRIELRTRAINLYAGGLFPEEGAAEHIVHERERLRVIAAETACNLARDHQSVGDLAEAVAAARRSLELDHYQDAAWQLLTDCLAAQGDETAAARARREHVRLRASLEDMRDDTEAPAATPRESIRSLSGR
jgi:two-component SAPR family response regulator